MLSYLTSEEEPRWTRWLLLLFIPLLWLYFVAAKGNAETKNHDVWAKDQKVYLNTASRIAEDPGGYFTPRQRTPGYSYFLSLFYSKDKFDVPDGTKPPFAMEWFERGKMINIVLSMFLLAGLYLFSRTRLPIVESGILVTTSGLLLFTYKAGMVQPEVSYWVLNTILFVLLGRMLLRPSWRLAVICGLLSVLTYFVKAGTQPLLFLFFVTWIIKLAWDLLSYRWRKSKGLLEEGEKAPRTLAVAGQGALVIVIFLVLLIPYLSGTKKRFGKAFYSVYTEYMMWLPMADDDSYLIEKNKDYMWAFYEGGARERLITIDEFNAELETRIRKRVTKAAKKEGLSEAETEARFAAQYKPLDELPSAKTYFERYPPADGVNRVNSGIERTKKRMRDYYRRPAAMLKYAWRFALAAVALRLLIFLVRRFLPDRKIWVEDHAPERSLARLFSRSPYLVFYGVGFFTGYLVLYAWYDALRLDARLMLSLYVPLLFVCLLAVRTYLGGLSVPVAGRSIYLGKLANLVMIVLLTYLSSRLLGGLELYAINEMVK